MEIQKHWTGIYLIQAGNENAVYTKQKGWSSRMGLLKIEFNQKAGSKGELSIQVNGEYRIQTLNQIISELSGCSDVVKIYGLDGDSRFMPENSGLYNVCIEGEKIVVHHFPPCNSIFDYATEIKKAALQIRRDAQIAYPEINEAVELEV